MSVFKIIYVFYAHHDDANSDCELFSDVTLKATGMEFNIGYKF